MKISRNSLDLIKKWEGKKIKAYLDPVGIPTIGYGTIRYPSGKPVSLGDEISDAEAEAFLKFDVDESVKHLDEPLKGIKLNQNQFDAIVSLSYNIGVGAFAGSTLLKNLKAKDIKGAAAEFDKWNKGTIKGKKKVLPGLTKRRKDERELFEKPGRGGTPIEVEESPQDKVTWLEAFRDGDDPVIVARAGKSKVIEVLVLKSSLKEDIIDVLRQYKNATELRLASPGKSIPKGKRIEITGKIGDIPKAENIPTLERSLLMIGARDDDPGNNNSNVEQLQERLKDLGYYRDNKIDGVFGTATDDAVRFFQAEVFGVAEADGKVGKITWNALFGKDAKKVPIEGKFEAGKNYLLLTKTSMKDTSGLFKLKLQYFKDGQSQDFIMTNSGQPRKQFYRKGKDSVSGSSEPLPEGKWVIKDILWKGGKDNYQKIWKDGLGPAKINLDYVPKNGTKRSFIQIHIDWNNKRSPGTAGCIGVYNIGDFKKLVTWLRDTDPRDLYVDWGLGSVKIP